ncbi:hypothetical protein PC113_g2593 [Phytophthora cactorum]|uniref:Uncharacterized protein n=1 Tax=Phytophthora cactorum TaxID=29920 RepID=A0A8T0ZVX5_9STRA|nr:hypothetical protein PC113_g2593 [Phytophthora cactorum]KAG3189386.1 hypothetical protein C6341_g2226 [Phytophthora cactorum]
MKKRPKNKTKLKGAKASKSAPVVQAGNKYYVRTSAHDALRVRYPVLEKQLLDYVAEMRKNRKLCVTTKCLILMMAKFDQAGTPHHPQWQQNQKRNAGGCGLVC